MRRYLTAGLTLIFLLMVLSGCYPLMKYQWEQTVEQYKADKAAHNRDVEAEATKARWDKEAAEAKDKTLSQEQAKDTQKHTE